MTGGTTLFGGENGDLLIARGTSSTALVAGIGNETLTGTGAFGNHIFYGNSVGADSIVGGSGKDIIFIGNNSTIDGGYNTALIVFSAGRNGGTVQVNGFRPGQGNNAKLQGYRPGEIAAYLANSKTVTVNGLATTQITLSNGTNIQFVGVTDLKTTNFF